MPIVCLAFSHPTLGRLWQQARDRLATDGVDLRLAHQMQIRDWTAFAAESVATADVVYLDISRHFPSFEPLVAATASVRLVAAGGLESRAALPQDDGVTAALLQRYIKVGTPASLADGVRALLCRAGLRQDQPEPPAEPILAAIHHPDSDSIWNDAQEYLAWRDQDGDVVAILGDRNSWLNGDVEAMDACIAALERVGLVAMPIFCDADLANGLGDESHPLTALIATAGDRLGAIWNAAMVHGVPARSCGGAPFARHDVPVLQLVRAWMTNEAEWRASAEGMSPSSITFSLIRPEMMGTIDPTVYAASHPLDPEAAILRRPMPLADQIARLAGRTKAWTRLRRLPNGRKRIAILLHNPPCKGVEGTIGQAVSLDAASSVVALLRRLAAEGYDVGGIPTDGAALIALFLERKAISEFRWTNVEETIAKGGMLAEIGEAEYRADFDRLPPELRDRVDKAWGAFPARSMVRGRDSANPTLVVTGLLFGNVLVMTEPKRGCWGARCDGEVCRILHEPDIAPPHHWLATFWYIRKQADALVVMGAEGPLEYLPGKRAGLSEDCFPSISVGDLPVIYPYVLNNVGEGLIARRRGRAVLVDHLSAPVAQADHLGGRWDDLAELHRQHAHAQGTDNSRKAQLLGQLRTELTAMGLLAEDADPPALELAVDQLPRRLAALRKRTLQIGLHTLGAVPDEAETALYLAEARGVGGNSIDEEAFRAALARCGDEIDAVVAALSGRTVRPGPGGPVSRGRPDILPTGRNLYGTDLALLPTRAACVIGARMGERLLRAYLADEGTFPRTIGITLWSSDAFQADGELSAQILWLLGCGPRYGDGGAVTGVEVLPLQSLTLRLDDGSLRPRPRIDVVVQMSSVVRDVLPGLYALFDQAVSLVAALDEDEERNFVRAHVRERMEALRDTLRGADEPALRRLASYRCFSSGDGAYGAGVKLALDASAWQDDADLAEVLINTSGHAFDGDGKAAPPLLGEYAALVGRMDVAYQRAASATSDVLAHGCTLDILGGSAAAKRGLGKGAMRLYWGDTHSSVEGEVRTLREEVALSLASSLVNQDWFEQIKTRGYSGGTEVGGRANHLYAWAATTRQVDKAQFDAVHDMYIRNTENRAWLRDNNIYALEELTRRLLEAEARGLWRADARRLDELRAAMLSVEGDMEDAMGHMRGEVQGGSVDIMTRETVKEWNYDYRVR